MKIYTLDSIYDEASFNNVEISSHGMVFVQECDHDTGEKIGERYIAGSVAPGIDLRDAQDQILEAYCK